jgi:hypothetical protein
MMTALMNDGGESGYSEPDCAPGWRDGWQRVGFSLVLPRNRFGRGQRPFRALPGFCPWNEWQKDCEPGNRGVSSLMPGKAK